MLSNVPPMISATISDTPFCKEWHDKEIEPDWNKRLLESDYDLVYYRPTLFFSYEGKVTQKAWVGNKAVDDDADGDVGGARTAGVLSQEEANCNMWKQIPGNGKDRKHKRARMYKSYRMPTLKSAAADNLVPASTHPIPDSESSPVNDLESTVMVDYPLGEEKHVKNEDSPAVLYGLKKYHYF